MLKPHFALLHLQGLGIGAVIDFAIFGHKPKHTLHIGKALFDLAIQHAQKIQRNVKLNHERIDQDQIAERHGAVHHAHGGPPDHEGHGHRNNQSLAHIEHRQRRLAFDRRLLPALHALIIATGFEGFIVEVLDGLVIQQRVDSANIGL